MRRPPTTNMESLYVNSVHGVTCVSLVSLPNGLSFCYTPTSVRKEVSMTYPAGDVTMAERSRSRKVISTGLFIFASIALHSTCYGSLITFETASIFLQTGLVVSTETFDELPPNTVVGTGTAVLHGITYTSDQPLA